MLTLPPNLEAEFKLEIQQLEAGRRMKYVTSFERIARLEEALSLVTRQLNRRLGNIDDRILDFKFWKMELKIQNLKFKNVSSPRIYSGNKSKI